MEERLSRSERDERYKPINARTKLFDLMVLARVLYKEIPWIHSVGYGRNPGPTAIRGSKSPSDTTAEVAINQRHLRNKYRKAVRHIESAKRQLDLANEILGEAVEAADQNQENRFLPREYDLPIKDEDNDYKLDDEGFEFAAAQDAQRRREDRGEGYGES